MNLRSNKVIAFEDCSNANLIVDAVYEGGSAGNAGDDPISRLLPGAGNQGGFRAAGSGADKKFVVLYTSGADPDWPDELDASTGQFTYYGDNKRPGHDLHDTARGGNALLRHAFGLHHLVHKVVVRSHPFSCLRSLPHREAVRRCDFAALRSQVIGACRRLKTWSLCGSTHVASASRTTRPSSQFLTSPSSLAAGYTIFFRETGSAAQHLRLGLNGARPGGMRLWWRIRPESSARLKSSCPRVRGNDHCFGQSISTSRRRPLHLNTSRQICSGCTTQE